METPYTATNATAHSRNGAAIHSVSRLLRSRRFLPASARPCVFDLCVCWLDEALRSNSSLRLRL